MTPESPVPHNVSPSKLQPDGEPAKVPSSLGDLSAGVGLLDNLQMTTGEYFLFAFVLMAIPLIFIGVPIAVFTGRLKKFALRPLERAFEGIDWHLEPQPGDVFFVYHTYRGFRIWAIQTEHRVNAPADQALMLLKRLLRFNLTWGMMSAGMLFIPFVSLGNYYAQRRAIERQRQ